MRGDRTLLILAGVALLSAADPAWKTKPVAQWDEEDSKQVLAGSAWVKRAVPVELPQLSPEQRREGGVTGGGRGVGLGGLEGRAPTSARDRR